MGRVLVVDGSDVCRAPVVAFTLQRGLTGLPALDGVAVESRGLEAQAGRTMCESAAGRLGFTGPAIAHFGAHRSLPLSVADVVAADLVLTAERGQRSAVVRMLPGTQARVFTWKEALVLAEVLGERRSAGTLAAPSDLAGLARALHGARGSIASIEPAVRTGIFHWRRGADADPLSIPAGHDRDAEHARITQESAAVATSLARRLGVVLQAQVEARIEPAPARWWQVRRSA